MLLVLEIKRCCSFLLNQQVKIPNDVIPFVSLQELTIANANYSISLYNNTLGLVDYAANTHTFTKTPGHDTFLTALSVVLANGVIKFLGIIVT